MTRLALLLGLLLLRPAAAVDAEDGQRCLREADLVCAQNARDALLASQPEALDTLALNARTLFHEGRYAEAVSALDAFEDRGGASFAEEAPYRETAEATRGFVTWQGRGVRVRYALGLDVVLAEEAAQAVEAARATLDPLLGGGPAHDIVLDLFPDGRSFIAASGLPPEAVRTTGVVALSKWTRLLVTSPRALARGYAWKDTIAHEYVHLLVSWRTGDRAPVWVQEGMAKFLEGYWRGERTGHLSAYQQSLLARALASNNFVPFEKFKSSMAYLDSGEEAALAFAQVATMIAFLVEKGGDEALSGMLDELRSGKEPGRAVSRAAGFPSFDAFRDGWLTWLRTLPLVQEQLAALPVVLDGEGGDFADDPLLAARTDLARYARLGDLLREAGRPKAALVEYAKAEDPSGPPSPLLMARRAACHIALGARDQALAEARRGAELYPEFALLQVTLGGLLEAAGEPELARRAFLAAHDLNPFDPGVQEAVVRLSEALGDATTAARHRRYLSLLASGGMAKGG